MLLKKLWLKDFKTFRNYTEISFEKSTDAPTKNIILIWWKNWAWKTSILQAINIILYGIDVKDIIKYINKSSIKNWDFDCILSLSFETDTGDEIIFTRRRFLKKWLDIQLSIENVDNLKPTFIDTEISLRKNWELQSADENMWHEFVDVAIPKWVSQFFFFAGEKIEEMASDDTPNLLRDGIEKTIWLEKIKVLISDLEKARNKIIKTAPANARDEDVKNKLLEVEVIENRITQFSNKFEEIEKEVCDYQSQVDQKKQRHEQFFGSNIEIQSYLTEIDKKLIEYKTKLWVIDAQIKGLLQDKLPFCFLADYKNLVLANIAKAKRYWEVSARKSSLDQTSIKIIEGLFKPKDIVWNNDRNDDYYDVIHNKLTSILSEWDLDKPLLDITESDWDKISKIWNNVLSGSESLNVVDQREHVLREITRLEKEREISSIQPERAKEQKELADAIQETSEILGRLSKDREDVLSNMSKQEEERSFKLLELQKSQESNEAYRSQKITLDKIDKYMHVLKKYVDLLRKEKLDSLIEHVSYMFKKLYRKDNIDRVDIDPDNFYIQLYNKDGYIVHKRDLSDWEKVLFAISMIWGLWKTAQLKLPIVIDAPFSELDKDHRYKILQDYFPSASHQVIILTKDWDIDPWSENYNLIKDHILMEKTLDFDNETQMTSVRDWFFL